MTIMTNLKDVYNIPGNLGLPILGEVLEQFTQHQQFFLDRFYRYGPIFKTKILYMKAICLAEEKANQMVLRDRADHFSNEEGWVFLKPFFGGGLFTQDGAAHARAKKFNLITKLAREHFEAHKNLPPLSVLDFFRQLTLKTMLYLVFGESIKDDIETLIRWFVNLNDGIQTILRIDIPLTKYGRSLGARRNLEKYILNKISERTASSKSSFDILSLLINSVD
ncbi:MAG: hypothetical protein RLZZ148_3043, partial [Cyanobacteriota bacterium]